MMMIEGIRPSDSDTRPSALETIEDAPRSMS